MEKRIVEAEEPDLEPRARRGVFSIEPAAHHDLFLKPQFRAEVQVAVRRSFPGCPRVEPRSERLCIAFAAQTGQRHLQ